MRRAARVAAAARRLRRLPKTQRRLPKTTTAESKAAATETTAESKAAATETTTERKAAATAMKGKASVIKKILYGESYDENDTEAGCLEGLYDPLSKLNVVEGTVELASKTLTKGYHDIDLGAAEATKSMFSSVSGYDQIEQSSLVKKGVRQGEIIIGKLDQALAGIERMEKVLGTGGGGGGRGGGGGGGAGAGEGSGAGGGGGDEGSSSGGGDEGWDFDNPFF